MNTSKQQTQRENEMTTSFNTFTVQVPMANGTWYQCGNSRYMSRPVAEAYFKYLVKREKAKLK